MPQIQLPIPLTLGISGIYCDECKYLGGSRCDIFQTQVTYEEGEAHGPRRRIRCNQCMKAYPDEAVIPQGIYCHEGLKNCPYWRRLDLRPEQEDGWCRLLGYGDKEINDSGGLGLLWDGVKECGIKDEETEDEHESKNTSGC